MATLTTRKESLVHLHGRPVRPKSWFGYSGEESSLFNLEDLNMHSSPYPNQYRDRALPLYDMSLLNLYPSYVTSCRDIGIPQKYVTCENRRLIKV
jgi:hypothetical protein